MTFLFDLLMFWIRNWASQLPGNITTYLIQVEFVLSSLPLAYVVRRVVMFSEVSVCSTLGGRVLPHLYPIILPLVPCPLWGGGYPSPRWGVPQFQAGGIPVPHGGIPVPGRRYPSHMWGYPSLRWGLPQSKVVGYPIQGNGYPVQGGGYPRTGVLSVHGFRQVLPIK